MHAPAIPPVPAGQRFCPQRPPRLLFAALTGLSLLAGCDDYRLGGIKDAAGAGDTALEYDPTADTADIPNSGDTSGVVDVPSIASNASINVIFQYSSFGSSGGTCVFDVAFYTVADDDGMGDGGTAQTISMPEDPGTCAYTHFDPDDTGTGGSMTVQGTLDAGAELHATNASFDITLTREESDDGSLRYRWNECARENFPFAQALSLSGDGVEGAIPAFSLPDVIAVGPDLVQLVPSTDDLDLGILPQSLSEPLEWNWAWSTDFPSTAEGSVAFSEMFILRNARSSDNQLLESLACLPSADGSLTVTADDLSQLTPDPGDDSTYAAGQLDAYFAGAEAEAPWGQTLRAQSMISMSGLLRLSP